MEAFARPAPEKTVQIKGYVPANFKVLTKNNAKIISNDQEVTDLSQFQNSELTLVIDPTFKNEIHFSSISNIIKSFLDYSKSDENSVDDDLFYYINMTVAADSSCDWLEELNKQIKILSQIQFNTKISKIATCAEFFHNNNIYTVALNCDPTSSWIRTSIDNKLREKLHEYFQISNDSKIFLGSLAINYKNSSLTTSNEKLPVFDEQIFCPHQKIEEELSENIISGVIQGKYRYMHYRPQDDRDHGWGCAYRSLQTLVSWISYNSRPDIIHPPTFNQIQSALVETGDKPKSFLGSRQWIGSFEVSTVLNQLYEIECRIVHVSKGSEMASQARFLINHFNSSKGAPIMIGGGVLAHTIIGCKLNKMSGEVQFLILDPHFTGKDDQIDVILKEGWVGWKGLDFWKDNAFYNMCVPII